MVICCDLYGVEIKVVFVVGDMVVCDGVIVVLWCGIGVGIDDGDDFNVFGD